ncbi:hypothetical protein NML04_04080 [Clostridium perfringens]|uniref:hypothetical protein n=1 Tax=Clostridium perfringens TaxID=1502 RepID=UPI0020938F76|nr:hypothetical protein [Clostridium perfringens]MCO6002163.1 hypothetical protein [Clostridium perfringens]MCO7394207.1 hypothetical protein [Clostridium perfringens]MCP8914863.1 hypothetical protein [Clostridium perfringens]MCP8964716.1 hypothetical protein [Clostridium perfringens]
MINKLFLDLNNFKPNLGSVERGDSIELNIKLLNDEDYSRSKFRLLGAKSDGKSVEQIEGLNLEEKDLKVVLEDQFVNCEGIVKLELNVVSGETEITTKEFYFFVSNTMNASIIDSADSLPTLEKVSKYVDDAVDNLEALKGASEDITIINSEFKENEIKRKANEMLREKNEKARLQTEDIRITEEEERETNELERIQAENNRKVSESNRKSSENTRVTNERAREEAELNRQSTFEENEEIRNLNENLRIASEKERVKFNNNANTDELNRKEAEKIRVLAEVERKSSEESRVAAEAIRQNTYKNFNESEEERKNNEINRQEAEVLRIEAETRRDGIFAQKEDERNTSFIENETIREEAFKISEKTRKEAESERIKNENLRVDAEKTRISVEEGRITAESARVEAENSRIVAEEARVESDKLRDKKVTEFGKQLVDFDLKLAEIEKKINYITPELFGAIGDGKNDDTQALLDCFNYANENFINVKLQNKIYQSTKMIKTNGCYDIEGRNSIIKAIGEMDILFIVDKTLDDLNNIKNKGISFIDGINFEGGEFVNTTFYIKQGSRIKVRDITTLGGKIQSCLLGNNEGLNLWELDMAHCRCDASYGSGKQGKYALKMEGSMSDNSLNDILCINGSENWAHIKTASSFITKIHGYSYPEDMACDVGFYVYGSGTYLSKVVCDTPRKIGMVLDGNASTVRDISIGKYVEKVEEVTGVKVISNFNVIDGVFTNGDNVNMITLDTEKYPSITDFKCYNLITQTGCKRDIHVTGKLPHRLEFDKKVSSVTDLFIDNQFLFHNQTFYVGSPNKDITFKIPLSSALYTVNLYEITGKSIPKYKIYNATNTGFSISILGEYTENLIVKIKVDMDY